MLSGIAVIAAAPVAVVGSAVLNPASAQDYTSGSIAGRVVDRSGNPVAGATVTLTSLGQGFTRTASSGSTGGFRFSGLPTGNYSVKVEGAGFPSQTFDNVRATAGETQDLRFVVGDAPAEDVMIVEGTKQAQTDFSNTTTGINLDVPDLVADIPVGRDLTSLIKLAPTASQGDSAFGNLASVGGSSVAENAYYLNGLNITDFNNYLGSSLVPFEFYQTVEVKTGGYPAEFGRATGAVINAVTKSGTNDFMAAVHVNWEPNVLSSDAPNTYRELPENAGNVASVNELDKNEVFDTILEVGGPIIKDRLFVYGIVELNDSTVWNSSGVTNSTLVDEATDPFYGFKVDGYITDDHHVEFTFFDTGRTLTRTVYDFDKFTNVTAAAPSGQEEFQFGGESFVAKYTGTLTNWLTISGAYGKNKDRSESIPLFGASALPFTLDNTLAGSICGGPGALCNGQSSSVEDFPQRTEREFYRADVDLYFNFLGDHHVRGGFDLEQNFLEHNATRTGSAYNLRRAWIYRTCGALTAQCIGEDGDIVGVGDEYVEINHFSSGGVFDSENIAYYLQDEWDVTSSLTLNMGVRLDQFNNFTADGSQFVDFNDLWAPRVGFSWDPWGKGEAKLFGNFGIYFLPVAGNTAFRQGAQEFFFREYWTFSGFDGNGEPILDTQITNYNGGTACPYGLAPGSAGAGSLSCGVTGDGSVQNPTSSISRNLEATQENEYILGYEHQFGDWLLGLTYTFRDLVQTAEDVSIDEAVVDYCVNTLGNSQTDCSAIWTGFHQYTIINPGEDSEIVLNELTPDQAPGDDLRTVTFSAADLGYPKAERTFHAVEFSFERVANDDKWYLKGSYTWSKSEGNTEGYVQSDFGQDDAGITQDFDKVEFTDGAFGPLPNHRAHRIKIWGSYKVTENLLFGTRVQVESPRKLSCWGFHPRDQFGLGPFVNLANLYGAASHYCGGVLSPRGEGEETDWVFDVDVGVRYNIEVPQGPTVTLRADVFNIFNFDAVQMRYEFGELNAGAFDNPRYGLPTEYQTPRYVRLGVDIVY